MAIPTAAPDRMKDFVIETELDAPPGDYAVEAALDIAPLGASASIPAGEVSVQVGQDAAGARVSLAAVAQATRESSPLPLRLEVHHEGGRLPVRLRIAIPLGAPPATLPGRLWVNELALKTLPTGR
jgi:hypothetical protein